MKKIWQGFNINFSEGELSNYVHYGSGPLLVDNSQFSAESKFISQREDVWTTPSIFSESQRRHSSGTKNWVIPQNVQNFDFTLPCQEGMIMAFSGDIPVEYIYRVDSTHQLQRGKLVEAGGKNFYVTGPVRIGEKFSCHTAGTHLTVLDVVLLEKSSYKQEILDSTININAGVGLVIKMASNQFYHCRYSSSKSQADIDIFAISVLFNIPVAVNDYSLWVSIRQNNGTSFSPLHEKRYLLK